MRKPATKTAPIDAGAVAKRYGWYIARAFEFRKREIEKQCANARKIIAEEPRSGHPRDTAAYESLEGMADHLEWVQREFDEAAAALKAAGIE